MVNGKMVVFRWGSSRKHESPFAAKKHPFDPHCHEEKDIDGFEIDLMEYTFPDLEPGPEMFERLKRKLKDDCAYTDTELKALTFGEAIRALHGPKAGKPKHEDIPVDEKKLNRVIAEMKRLSEAQSDYTKQLNKSKDLVRFENLLAKSNRKVFRAVDVIKQAVQAGGFQHFEPSIRSALDHGEAASPQGPLNVWRYGVVPWLCCVAKEEMGQDVGRWECPNMLTDESGKVRLYDPETGHVYTDAEIEASIREQERERKGFKLPGKSLNEWHTYDYVDELDHLEDIVRDRARICLVAAELLQTQIEDGKNQDLRESDPPPPPGTVGSGVKSSQKLADRNPTEPFPFIFEVGSGHGRNMGASAKLLATVVNDLSRKGTACTKRGYRSFNKWLKDHGYGEQIPNFKWGKGKLTATYNIGEVKVDVKLKK